MTSLRPHVIILHGLARSAFSMRRLANALQKADFVPLNYTYPSRKFTLQELADQLLDRIQEQVTPETPLHFVSHSMGGLVGRELMTTMQTHNWQNAVFLAPPHQGSKIARTLSSHPATQTFFTWFYGPAGLQIAEGPELPLPPCPFGVIAGTQSRSLLNPTSWLSRRLFQDDERSDGTVRVEETQLDNMIDFAEVATNHTTIMNHPRVHDLTVHFFRHSHFPPPSD